MNNAQVYVLIGSAAACLLVIGLVIFLIKRRKPERLDTKKYQDKWADMQMSLRDKTNWPAAIIDADKMLDEVLKKLRYKGKSTGERLVAAQRDIKNNNIVWYGHKLRNRVAHGTDAALHEREVKNALIGIKHALKDLGALPKQDAKQDTKQDTKQGGKK